MRLIDANKLKPDTKVFLSAYAEKLTECYSQEAIDNALTVDAVPVKHGHWIEKEYEYDGLMAEKMFRTCSVCGEEQMQKLDDNFKPFLTPYCANCGAKMDGGNENA